MSKQQKNKNSRYATIGSLIFQSAFDEEGNRLIGEYKTDEKGRKLYALKLDKNTKITVNGVDMTGKTLYVSRPDTKLTRLLDKGVIDQNEYESKLADFSAGGRLEFVQMEITADLEK
jgi:flagellar basal body rod protein FlgF